MLLFELVYLFLGRVVGRGGRLLVIGRLTNIEEENVA